MYAAHLADGAFGRLPAAALWPQAQDSVGAALAMAGREPRLLDALQDAFMSGLSTSCMVIGTLCLVGALGALVWLPGRVRPMSEPEDARSEAAEPVAAVA